jgi:polar amino acid transport system substrate-binding protein
MTELVRSIFTRLGHPVTVDYQPWKRGYQETLSGKFTATFPYSFSPERQRDVLFSAPLRTEQVYFFVRADSPLTYSVLADLRGARLCVALGYNLFPPIQQALDQGLVELITVREMDSCIRMIESRRADATFLTADAGWLLIEQAGTRANFKTLAKPLHTVQEFLIVARNRPGAAQLIEAFNGELRRYIQSGRYRRLFDKAQVQP